MFHHSLGKAWILLATLIGTGGRKIQLPAAQGRVGKGALACLPVQLLPLTLRSPHFAGVSKGRPQTGPHGFETPLARLLTMRG